ncbi:hypothetical protein DSM104299_03546 [Baekduia alba]|uniref:hypothetical protein n=1 Tax=Baekduia alba TaxID=2997333 RepID=UPI002340A5EE|nr:hypothetical protein [Baekduia alba]WCB94807.1 hypothetical protein DSM104299_03546 [Baekduia alba]
MATTAQRRRTRAQRQQTRASQAVPPAAPRVDASEILAYLTATAAVFIAVGAAIIAVVGPGEDWETRLWVIAVVVGLPGGFLLARRQQRAGAATAMGVALSTSALMLGIVVRWAGDGGHAFNAVLALSGVVAVVGPFLAARWVPMTLLRHRGWHAVTVMALAVLVLPFLPPAIGTERVLWIAVPLAVVMFAALRTVRIAIPWRGARTAIEVVFGVAVFLLVFRTTTVEQAVSVQSAYSANFFLGPVNAVVHGRPALVDTWSQYGLGMLYGLRSMFWVVPLGYGGFILLQAFLTGAQYVLFYGILRAATRRPLLAATATLVAISRQVFNTAYGTYFEFPSTGPLRFGAPYLVIGLAVLGARRPGWARPVRALTLLAVAVAAVWSFESFTYTIVTALAITVVEALADDDGHRLRRVVIGAASYVGAAVAGVALFTLAVAVFAGNPDWGPYIDYIKLYTRGFGQLPVTFFGQGPLMGALTILSAAALLWVVLERRVTIPTVTRVALAGFTGFAIASYTYYLGRSVDNNLVHLLPPVVAYLALWVSVLLGTKGRRAVARPALAVVAILVVAAALTIGNAWREVRAGWGHTALAQVIPHGGGASSLSSSLRLWWGNPVMDADALEGGQLLARYWRPHQPALILARPDLTTELLMRSGRRNALPIGHPSEDDLIASSASRIARAVDAVPAGTDILIGQDYANGLSPLQAEALNALSARYRIDVVKKGGHFLVLRTVEP